MEETELERYVKQEVEELLKALRDGREPPNPDFYAVVRAELSAQFGMGCR